ESFQERTGRSGAALAGRGPSLARVRRTDHLSRRAQFLPPSDRAASTRDLPRRVLEETGEAESSAAPRRGLSPPIRRAVAPRGRDDRRSQARRRPKGHRAGRAVIARGRRRMRPVLSTPRDLDLLKFAGQVQLDPPLPLLQPCASGASQALEAWSPRK